MGFFNRPTFLVFAVVPYLYWVLDGGAPYFSPLKDYGLIVKRTVSSTVAAFFIAIAFILCDSFYYGSLTTQVLWNAIFATKFNFDSIVNILEKLTVTPQNFLIYNLNQSNLSKHGLHPWYVHIVVNAQLLFGFLSLFALLKMVKILLDLCRPKGTRNTVKGGHIMLLLSYFIPLILLSVFPHQEPRFIIPLLYPISALFSKYVFGRDSSKIFTIIWVMFNLLFSVLFGVFHQGGVIPSLSYLQKNLNYTNNEPQQHVIYYHTYMPPRFLLTIPNKETEVAPPIGLKVHDLAGAPEEILHDKVKNITLINPSADVFVVSPATLDAAFCNNNLPVKYGFVRRFSRHLSMENPPSLEKISCHEKVQETCNRPCTKLNFIDRLNTIMSLNLYRVISWYHCYKASLFFKQL